MSSHLPASIFYFKKWYFDVQSEDGMFLFAYCAPMVLFGGASAELVVAVYPPGGGGLRRSFHIKGRRLDCAPGSSGASFGCGSLSVNKERARFSFSIGDTSIALDYSPMAPEWIPAAASEAEAGTLLVMGKNVLRWTVPMPCARVTGSVSMAGTSFTMNGYGYHDFVMTDIPPWRLPLRELLWGRAIGDKGTVIWNRPVFETGGRRRPVELGWAMDARGETSRYSHVSARFIKEQSHTITDGNYPEEMELEMGDDSGRRLVLRVVDTKLLLGERVADVQEFSSKLERWLYRRFTNDPVEYKLLSRAFVPGGISGITAAHEWIRWGRR